MKPFLDKLMNTVANATQAGRAGKKLSFGLAQHSDAQRSEKQSFQSVLKTAQKDLNKTASKDKAPEAEAPTQQTATSENTEAESKPQTGDSEKVSAEQGITADNTQNNKTDAPSDENANNIQLAADTQLIAKIPLQTETAYYQANNEISEPSNDSSTEDNLSKEAVIDTTTLPQAQLALSLQLQAQQTIEAAPAQTAESGTDTITSVSATTDSSPSAPTAPLTQTIQNNPTGFSDTITATQAQVNNTNTQETADTKTTGDSKGVTLDASNWQAVAPEAAPTIDISTSANNTIQASAEKPEVSIDNNASVTSFDLSNVEATGNIDIQVINNPAPLSNEAMLNSDNNTLASASTSEKTDSQTTSETTKSTTAPQTPNSQNKASTEAPAAAAPLAPVPMLVIQNQPEASIGIQKSDAPVQTQATDKTESIATETNSADVAIQTPTAKEATTDNSNADTSNNKNTEQNNQQQPDNNSGNVVSTASKPAQKTAKNAIHDVSGTSKAKSSPAVSNAENPVPQENQYFDAINTANDAGANNLNGANIANISQSNVPVKETSGANLNELLTIRAQGADTVDQVGNGIQEGLRVNRPEIVIKLSPEDLGDVNVRLSTNAQQQLTARLMVSNPETQEVLHEQIHKLKQSLESQGIHVEHLSVSVAAKTDTSADQSKQSGSQNQQQNQEESRQQFSSQHSFQQQHQQAQQFYQQFSQNGSPKFATAPWQPAGPASGMDAGSAGPSATKAEQHNPNGSISVLA